MSDWHRYFYTAGHKHFTSQNKTSKTDDKQRPHLRQTAEAQREKENEQILQAREDCGKKTFTETSGNTRPEERNK